MNDRAVRGIAECVVDSRQVRATAPACRNIGLQNLFCNEMPEDGKLFVEGMVNPDQFLFHVRGRIRAANECPPRSGSWEYSSF